MFELNSNKSVDKGMVNQSRWQGNSIHPGCWKRVGESVCPRLRCKSDCKINIQGVPCPVSIQVPGSGKYALDHWGGQDKTGHDTQAKVDGRGAVFWRPEEGGVIMLMKSIAQQTLKRVFFNSYRHVLIEVVVFIDYTWWHCEPQEDNVWKFPKRFQGRAYVWEKYKHIQTQTVRSYLI